MIDTGASRESIWDAHFASSIRYHKAFTEYARVKARPRDFPTFVILFCGTAGAGKTRTATRLCEYLAASEGQTRYYKLPDKSTGFWCDDYDRHAVMFIDEMDGSRMRPTQFNSLADRYECVLPAHGTAGHQFIAKYLVICSNYLPKDWWPKRNAAQILQTTRRIHMVVPLIVPRRQPAPVVGVVHAPQGRFLTAPPVPASVSPNLVEYF